MTVYVDDRMIREIKIAWHRRYGMPPCPSGVHRTVAVYVADAVVEESATSVDATQVINAALAVTGASIADTYWWLLPHIGIADALFGLWLNLDAEEATETPSTLDLRGQGRLLI